MTISIPISPHRFSPGKDWPVNTNLQPGLSLLAPVKEELGPSLSWSDLILLAGTTALEAAADISLPFCTVGRADAEDGEGWRFLEPRVRFVVCVQCLGFNIKLSPTAVRAMRQWRN